MKMGYMYPICIVLGVSERLRRWVLARGRLLYMDFHCRLSSNHRQLEPFLNVMTSRVRYSHRGKIADSFLKNGKIVFVARNVNLPVLKGKKNYVADFETRPRHGYVTGLSEWIFIVTYLLTVDNVSLFLMS